MHAPRSLQKRKRRTKTQEEGGEPRVVVVVERTPPEEEKTGGPKNRGASSSVRQLVPERLDFSSSSSSKTESHAKSFAYVLRQKAPSSSYRKFILKKLVPKVAKVGHTGYRKTKETKRCDYLREKWTNSPWRKPLTWRKKDWRQVFVSTIPKRRRYSRIRFSSSFEKVQKTETNNLSQEIVEKARTILGTRQVLPGVATLCGEVQVEGTFKDGTKLVSVHGPICREDGDLSLALKGSFLPVPFLRMRSLKVTTPDVIPGELKTAKGSLTLLEGRKVKSLLVTNTCDRPIQVGSHFHLVETNKSLRIDRVKARVQARHPSGYRRSIRTRGDEKSTNLPNRW